jgi:mannosyltransferase OCH1-like enzyme
MGSRPNHPFFEEVVQSLVVYDHDWLSPYLTIMYSTGPLFLSEVRENYLREDRHLENDRLFTLLSADYDKEAKSFFYAVPGSSWHGKDAQFILWMGKHVVHVMLFSCVIFIVTEWATWRLYRRVGPRYRSWRWRAIGTPKEFNMIV